MLNISGIREGVVLDHIQAGKSMEIYRYLGLGKMDCTVAIIKNARSSKMGRKDIIKIEGPLDSLDLDVLGYIDHNITVNIIRDDRIVEKMSESPQPACERHSLQKSPVHHIRGTGASAYLLSC